MRPSSSSFRALRYRESDRSPRLADRHPSRYKFPRSGDSKEYRRMSNRSRSGRALELRCRYRRSMPSTACRCFSNLPNSARREGCFRRLRAGESAQLETRSCGRTVVSADRTAEHFLSSRVGSLRKSITRNSASAIAMWRWLATRNIKVGIPSKGEMTAYLLNRSRATGRENRTKIRPVMAAIPNMPTTISAVVVGSNLAAPLFPPIVLVLVLDLDGCRSKAAGNFCKSH
jgi:hypothetical protein